EIAARTGALGERRLEHEMVARPANARPATGDRGWLRAGDGRREVERLAAEIVQQAALAGRETMAGDRRPFRHVDVQRHVDRSYGADRALADERRELDVRRPEPAIEVDHEERLDVGTARGARELSAQEERLLDERGNAACRDRV